MVVGYVLLRYGINKAIAAQPAGRAQRRALGRYEREYDIKLRGVYEYARKHESLAELPKLSDLLVRTGKIGSFVVVDDVGRLIRPIPPSARIHFLNDLEETGGTLVSLRHKRALKQFPAPVLRNLLGENAIPHLREGSPRAKDPTDNEFRREQARKANIASATARSAAADKASQQLLSLSEDLHAAGETRVSLSKLCEEANARGLRTAPGRPWSVSSASRALKRASAIQTAKG